MLGPAVVLRQTAEGYVVRFHGEDAAVRLPAAAVRSATSSGKAPSAAEAAGAQAGATSGVGSASRFNGGAEDEGRSNVDADDADGDDDEDDAGGDDDDDGDEYDDGDGGHGAAAGVGDGPAASDERLAISSAGAGPWSSWSRPSPTRAPDERPPSGPSEGPSVLPLSQLLASDRWRLQDGAPARAITAVSPRGPPVHGAPAEGTEAADLLVTRNRGLAPVLLSWGRSKGRSARVSHFDVLLSAAGQTGAADDGPAPSASHGHSGRVEDDDVVAEALDSVSPAAEPRPRPNTHGGAEAGAATVLSALPETVPWADEAGVASLLAEPDAKWRLLARTPGHCAAVWPSGGSAFRANPPAKRLGGMLRVAVVAVDADGRRSSVASDLVDWEAAVASATMEGLIATGQVLNRADAAAELARQSQSSAAAAPSEVVAAKDEDAFKRAAKAAAARRGGGKKERRERAKREKAEAEASQRTAVVAAVLLVVLALAVAAAWPELQGFVAEVLG
ncbi:hypothetical protein FNF28_05978 [Cafeteria roenbergensis]|uniref:Uncharacterized protein n=2 Tax=Cafeteria roenbergensis TaxID=33653 RepID=A0A5A8D586_CAFRO|nr:hypothetical protein FNF28_05978 [Cafeteria roenbergensis]